MPSQLSKLGVLRIPVKEGKINIKSEKPNTNKKDSVGITISKRIQRKIKSKKSASFCNI
jgi:hypothetical protein